MIDSRGLELEFNHSAPFVLAGGERVGHTFGKLGIIQETHLLILEKDGLNVVFGEGELLGLSA
jgi:hypothetical protein